MNRAAAGPGSRPIPRLQHRPPQAADLPECMQLLPPWLGLTDSMRAALPALWQRLIDEPSVMSTVTEDLARPVGARIQSWGVGMALPAHLVDAWSLDHEPQPGLARRAYAALLDGSWTPLNEREIGQANAQGRLRLASLHYDMRERDLGDPYVQSLAVMGTESFRIGLSGYNIEVLYYENHLVNEPWMRVTGYARRPHGATPPGAPALDAELQFYRCSRAEAMALVPGSSLRHIFEHQPPLFRLLPRQRLLLWLALFDEHDDALMQRLQVSAHGLKKLWRGIYERVEDVAPEFFGDSLAGDEGKRGPEKRRQVLAYVRQRLEEVRPWA